MQEVRVENKKVLVRLSGKLYVEEASTLREKMIEYTGIGYKDFIIDLTEVTYIDSSGLGVFVSIQKKAIQNGGGVKIKGLNGVVKELFELTRLDRVFEII